MKMIAIGGGEIGRPGTKVETLPIDKEIVRLSGKKHPKLLFVPTASGDSEGYCRVVEKHFGRRLGCRVEHLLLIKGRPTAQALRDKVLGTDIVYVGGGNTLRMLKIWRKCGLDKILETAAKRGIVLSGISAGAICWFKYGNSDSMKFSDARNPLIKLKGLGFVPLMFCPHYDVEKSRRPSLKRMIKDKGGLAVALENRTALKITDDGCGIITASQSANAYKVFRRNGKVIEQKLAHGLNFKNLDDLLA